MSMCYETGVCYERLAREFNLPCIAPDQKHVFDRSTQGNINSTVADIEGIISKIWQIW